jgi:hypothetical protein
MPSAPVRIQRRRTKGWKMPPNTVYVGRPAVFQNRWKVGVWSNRLGKNLETAAEAVDCFRNMMTEAPHLAAYACEVLRGKNLACWCKLDQPCHADVLLELANKKRPDQ